MLYSAPECMAKCPVLKGEPVHDVCEVNGAEGCVVLASYGHGGTQQASALLEDLDADNSAYLESVRLCHGPVEVRKKMFKTVYACQAEVEGHNLQEFVVESR